jgi:hypothetical protein
MKVKKKLLQKGKQLKETINKVAFNTFKVNLTNSSK